MPIYSDYIHVKYSKYYTIQMQLSSYTVTAPTKTIRSFAGAMINWIERKQRDAAAVSKMSMCT